MLGEGLRLAAADIKPLQFEIPETKARSANKRKIVNCMKRLDQGHLILN
jgi:hypothetical protein